MSDIGEQKQQLASLASVLEEMNDYLPRLEQGCETLAGNLHGAERGQAMISLIESLDGMSYCPKLLNAACAILAIDPTAELWEGVSINSYVADLGRVFNDLNQAAEDEDYSVLADLVEYDLVPAIQTVQQIFNILHRCYIERVG